MSVRFWVGVGFGAVGTAFLAWHGHAHRLTVVEGALHTLPFVVAVSLMLPYRYFVALMDVVKAVFGRRP